MSSDQKVLLCHPSGHSVSNNGEWGLVWCPVTLVSPSAHSLDWPKLLANWETIWWRLLAIWIPCALVISLLFGVSQVIPTLEDGALEVTKIRHLQSSGLFWVWRSGSYLPDTASSQKGFPEVRERRGLPTDKHRRTHWQWMYTWKTQLLPHEGTPERGKQEGSMLLHKKVTFLCVP